MNWTKQIPWVFSGIGVAVMITLFNWFFDKPVGKHLSFTQTHTQTGTGNIQAGRDVIISVEPERQTIHNVNYLKSEIITSNSLITVNPDKSWTVIVPPREIGVTLRLEHGDVFKINSGEKIEITASGYVNIGRGCFGPSGEPDYKDSTMDSPYKDHVGGLEMWIGDKNNRYFVGDHFLQKINHSGIPTFRVIESLYGYSDGNTGEFKVVIKKASVNKNP